MITKHNVHLKQGVYMTEAEKERVKNFTIPPITEEDIERGHQNYLRIMEEKRKSCLSRWYPLVKGIVPTPRTVIIKTDVDLAQLWDCKEPEGFDKLLVEIQKDAYIIGTPCFLRSGMTSNKHDWEKSCYLPTSDFETISKHVESIVQFSGMADLPMDVWVVRELLPTISPFDAFHGNMPITRERRYFINNGKVVCHHPYWPREALENQTTKKEWKNHLDALNTEPDFETEQLTEWSERIAKVIEGFWSVDWLYTKNGWYLIDMGVGESSYHWPDCPYNPHIKRTDISPMLESLMEMDIMSS